MTRIRRIDPEVVSYDWNPMVDVVWKSGMSCIGIVLTRDVHSGLQAYIGVGGGNNEETDKKNIAKWGSKLSFQEAKGFFPYLKKQEYKGAK